MSSLSWYEVVNGKQIMQGDIVNNCPVIVPLSDPNEGGKLKGEEILINCIVLSQSCDLLKKNPTSVIVCEYFTFTEYIKNLEPKITSRERAKDVFENLRKGMLHSYHLLSCSVENKLEYLVVSFKDIHTIPFAILQNHLIDNRLRLMSPYREHLSQSFARYFMRVGLPSDIKREDIPKEMTFE